MAAARATSRVEIEAGPADVTAGLGRLEDRDPVALGLGVFLDDDRVGAHRQRAAGENADGLARHQRVIVRAASRRLADQSERRRRGRYVLGAHGIAVHRGEIGGRLGQTRRCRCCEHAARGVGDRHHLCRQTLEGRDHARMCIAHGEQLSGH